MLLGIEYLEFDYTLTYIFLKSLSPEPFFEKLKYLRITLSNPDLTKHRGSVMYNLTQITCEIIRHWDWNY